VNFFQSSQIPNSNIVWTKSRAFRKNQNIREPQIYWFATLEKRLEFLNKKFELGRGAMNFSYFLGGSPELKSSHQEIIEGGEHNPLSEEKKAKTKSYTED
jgi:hypothetical protein